jgi:hypothetical protein
MKDKILNLTQADVGKYFTRLNGKLAKIVQYERTSFFSGKELEDIFYVQPLKNFYAEIDEDGEIYPVDFSGQSFKDPYSLRIDKTKNLSEPFEMILELITIQDIGRVFIRKDGSQVKIEAVLPERNMALGFIDHSPHSAFSPPIVFSLNGKHTPIMMFERENNIVRKL